MILWGWSNRKNLYGNSVVALDAKTGKYRCIFKPYTMTYGIMIAGAAQFGHRAERWKTNRRCGANTKVRISFFIERETGESLFPTIEDRKVPASNVPGERRGLLNLSFKTPRLCAAVYDERWFNHSFSPAGHDSLVKKLTSLRMKDCSLLLIWEDVNATLNERGVRIGRWGCWSRYRGALCKIKWLAGDWSAAKKWSTERVLQSIALYSGKALYSNYCSSCHGKIERGDERSTFADWSSKQNDQRGRAEKN